MTIKNKCVFTIGPESTGSMLVAKIIADVLGVETYGQWNGVGWIDKGANKVCHRSLPFNIPPQYPDIEQWISSNQESHDIFFVLTTRDITLSEKSRINRFGKNLHQVGLESIQAKNRILNLLNSEQKCFIFSYETFMYLELGYLKELYRFLGVESDFIPKLIDGNKKSLSHNISDATNSLSVNYNISDNRLKK